MNAIRNIIELENNNINIVLPDNYKYKKVEVIILPYDDKEIDTESVNADDFFSKYNIDLNNYKFNRDELYDR